MQSFNTDVSACKKTMFTNVEFRSFPSFLPSSSHLSTIHLLHFSSPLYIRESPRDLHQPAPTEAPRFFPPAGRDLVITFYFIFRSLCCCADTSVINTSTNCTAHSFDPTWAVTVITCHFSRPLKTLHKAQAYISPFTLIHMLVAETMSRMAFSILLIHTLTCNTKIMTPHLYQALY